MANMTFKASLLPSTDLGYSLGSNTQRWNIYGNLTGNADTSSTLNSFASIGSSSTTHNTALKDYFTSNYSSIPRNKTICFYDASGGNGSLALGYFLSGYDSNPYGGFFVAHYNTPYYVGIQNGTYTNQTILTSSNYTSYTVKKDGTGASGTWGISITGNAATSSSCTGNAATSSSCTGNAATATKLQTARKINGTDFDGTTDITTANWGTIRTLTIGNKGQSVNGSQNITWNLQDILIRAGNEFNFTADGISSIYFNYKTQSGTDATTKITNYYFDNGQRSITGVTLHAANFNGNAASASKWATAHTLTIGETGKEVDGTANISWGKAEILGESDTTKFYRGDQSWSNEISGGIFKVTNNENTVSIGNQDESYTHFMNSADIPFYFNKAIHLNGDLIPYGNSNSKNLGSSSKRWQKLYIGTADSYGSTTQPIYWNAGVPTAITYTANRLYYPSTTTAFTAGTHFVSDTKIAINSTSNPNETLYVNGLTKVADGTDATSNSAAALVVTGGLAVSKKANIGTLDGGQHIINGNVQLNAQSGSYNEGLRINRSTTGYANIYLGGTRSSASGAQTGGWWIGTLSTPNDATSTGDSITNTVFTISNNTTADTLSIKGTRGATIGTNSGWAIRPRLAIGTTYQTGYNLYVNGTSYLSSDVHIASTTDVGLNQAGALVIGTKTGENIGIDTNEIMARNNGTASTLYLNNEGGTVQVGATLQPNATNSKTLGTSSLRWSKLYIGTADSYGSTSQPIYWNAGVPATCNIISSGNYKNGFATIFDGNGYGEIACGLDWHKPTSTNDFDLRLHIEGTHNGLGIIAGSGFNSAFTATNFYGTFNGNASTAAKLQTARNIAITGAVTGNANFDGSGNISISTAVNHNHNWLNLAPGNKTASTGASQSDDTGPFSVRWYSTANLVAQQPSQYGFMITCATGKGSAEMHQLFLQQCDGHIYHRGTNGSNNASPPVFKMLWQSGDAVTGAVWNDYAEYRESHNTEFGYVVQEVGDDTLQKTSKRLDHFADVTSDTWGFAQGETEKAKTPIAVAGRVLVYPGEDRDKYQPGDCVCAGPNGKVYIMTREEIREWPDRIVGTVSCVPNYEEWGGGEIADRPSVKVNGRIWIKVK